MPEGSILGLFTLTCRRPSSAQGGAPAIVNTKKGKPVATIENRVTAIDFCYLLPTEIHELNSKKKNTLLAAAIG